MPRLLTLAILSLACTACQRGGQEEARPATGPQSAAPPQVLTLYAGRSLSLVEPVIADFTKATGIQVKVRDGGSAELASLLLTEGEASPADLFWAQESSSLGELQAAGRLAPAPKALREKLLPHFAQTSEVWLPISGRARVLAYAADVPEAELPRSVFDLTQPQFAGKVGWAPTNASFQAFVTAMRASAGEEKTRAWLEGMRANQAKAYPKNTAIIRAIGNGEVRFGLPNHYYLLRELAANPKLGVAQRPFADGDLGNLVNVTGVAVLKSSKQPALAARFMEFLLSKAAQERFAKEIFEYPLVPEVAADPRLLDPASLQRAAPKADLAALSDLKATRDLLRAVGLL